MRRLDKSGHPIPGHPELPVEKAAEINIWTSNSGTPRVGLSGKKDVEEDIEKDSSIDDNSRNSGIDTLLR